MTAILYAWCRANAEHPLDLHNPYTPQLPPHRTAMGSGRAAHLSLTTPYLSPIRMHPRTTLITATQGKCFACLRLNQHLASHKKTATCFSGRWLYFSFETSTGSETLPITTESPPPSASDAYTDVGSIPTTITSVSSIATTPRIFLCFMVFLSPFNECNLEKTSLLIFIGFLLLPILKLILQGGGLPSMFLW